MINWSSTLQRFSRISERTLLDLSFMKSSKFSVTTEFSDHEITRNLTMLLMNLPSTVIPSDRALPVVNSSRTSWLSLYEDGIWNEGEPLGPFPLLTIERYGRGTLIVLSEPSLLINQMRDEMDNGIFVSNLIEFISRDRENIIVDESHRDLTNPVQFTNSFVAGLDPYQKVGILVAISVIFLILNTSYPRTVLGSFRRLIDRLLSEKRVVPGEQRPPIEVVMEAHPDWDRRVLERLIKDIEGAT